MDEDDPRNPACIADNVGDNVGDVAGMGADLFGSFAESTCAALVIASASGGGAGIADNWSAMMFPVMLSSTGIIIGVLTMLSVETVYKVHKLEDVEKALKGVLVVSTVLYTPLVIALAYFALPETFELKHPTYPVLEGWRAFLLSRFLTFVLDLRRTARRACTLVIWPMLDFLF